MADSNQEQLLLEGIGVSLVALAEARTLKYSEADHFADLEPAHRHKRIQDELLCLNLAAVGLAPYLLPPEDQRRERILNHAKRALGDLIKNKASEFPILKEREKRLPTYYETYPTWDWRSRPRDLGVGIDFARFCEPSSPDSELELMILGPLAFMETLKLAADLVRKLLGIPPLAQPR